MTRPAHITLVEVGPRDGLQNEPWTMPVEHRIALVDALARSGLPVVEVGSFVSPRAVPQMAQTDAVLRGITPTDATRFPVLVPNVTGMHKAIAAGAREVSVFISATESFSQRNINCSIAQSLDRVAEVIDLARPQGIRVRGYLSCVLGCPYEGVVPTADVTNVAERLWTLGCHEISLGDTIGTGTPDKAQAMVRAVAERVPVDRLAAHFHDTYGQALANVLACMDVGVSVVDSAAGGLGGCPYAKGASGNLATEDLLYMLDGMGVTTGVAMDTLLDAVDLIVDTLAIPVRSKVHAARRAKDDRAGRAAMA